MLSTGGLPMSAGKITREQIIEGLGFEPVGGQGVNLLTGTRDFSGASGYLDLWHKDGMYNNLVVYSKDTAWGGIEYRLDIVKGEWYAFSAWIKSNASIGILNFTTDSGNFNIDNPKIENYAPNEWRRVFINLQAKVTKLANFRFELKENYKISICGLKAEPGVVTNPIWTPSPYDILTSLDDLVSRVAALEGKAG